MKNFKFDRKMVESPEYKKLAEERMKKRIEAAKDHPSLEERIKSGKVVIGPLDENGKPFYGH